MWKLLVIYVAFTLALQSEEMTEASGLQGVNVSHFALFVITIQNENLPTTSLSLFFFFKSAIMASAISFKQSQYIYP